MSTPTYDLIDSTVLGSSASSVTFSGIAADWRDLVLVTEHKGNTANVSANVRFNSDSGGNYTYVLAAGNGSSTSYASGSGTNIFSTTASTSTAALTTHQIMDYSATDKHKTVLTRRNRADDQTGMFAQRWADTSAITNVEVFTSSDNFAAGSTFYLYGISA